MKKLTKSTTDRQVSGVLGGISEYLGIDSTIVRVIFLISVFAGVGSPILLYILLAVILPEADSKNGSEGFNSSNSGSSRSKTYTSRTIKEAKPVEKEEEDDWSDF